VIVSRLISGCITRNVWINYNQIATRRSLHLTKVSYHSVHNPSSNRTDEIKGGPVHTMKASGGTGGRASHILNLGNIWR